MDWIRDNAGISENDFARVFKYEPKPSTVVRKLSSDKEPTIWSLETDKEWDHWVGTELPSPGDEESGLVLIIARRTGEPPIRKVRRANTNEWLGMLEADARGKNRPRAFSSDIEKLSAVSMGHSSPPPVPIGRRSLRTLPFSSAAFRSIAAGFCVHGSIARTISRADVPVFSAANVHMGDTPRPSIVYTCRSSNAWEMDLALTLTYFPHCGLTYAILFGCPLTIEQEVIKRVNSAAAETHHPLLVPGIFTELERVRHVNLVEKTIDELELKIIELDYQSSQTGGRDRAEVEKHNQEKRSAWLDTTYLRNNLITWSTQLRKMASHEKELSCGIFRSRVGHATASKKRRTWNPDGQADPERDDVWLIDGDDDIYFLESYVPEEMIDEEAVRLRLRRTGRKIRNRLWAIIDEYDDKIRDCTMRVDGMAMATQWANGETNVEIALATSRDSQHMRSIALITMVFLPGTFLASFFSMTFFDWFGDNPTGSMVSGSLWIYIVITAAVTLLTVGSWYYWVIWRSSTAGKKMMGADGKPSRRWSAVRPPWKRLFSRNRARRSPGVEDARLSMT